MRVADKLAEDVWYYGHAFCDVIDTPNLFVVERIPPQVILGGYFYA